MPFVDWKAKVELFEQLRREHEFGVGTIACQIASNSDPLFAFNLDPLVMACAGSPQGGPARRGVPIARLTQRRAGGSCGPTGASRQRIARSVPAEAARRDDCLKFGEIQVADCLQCFG